MLDDITNSLPLFEEYRNLLPTAWELEEPLRELYRVYVNFCIDTYLFFRSKKWSKYLGFSSYLEGFLIRCEQCFETLPSVVQRVTLR